MFRTNTCGELRKTNEGETVTLSGWIDKIRTHGSLTFIDLRDRYGITQITLKEFLEAKKESVIKIEGVVKIKPEPNKKLATGDIEIEVQTVEIISNAKPLPLDANATEDIKLRYRY